MRVGGLVAKEHSLAWASSCPCHSRLRPSTVMHLWYRHSDGDGSIVETVEAQCGQKGVVNRDVPAGCCALR